MSGTVTSPTLSPRSGGRILIDQLQVHGVRQVFCVPGESYLDALDSLHDSTIQTIVCRQEGGATMMAEAQGKLTGRPGVCFVTRGPGATNASAAIHIAQQDSTPLIVFVGQIERASRDREAFQEVNYRSVFGTMAKWVTEIDDPARVPELVSRAFHVATNGRPGPVVVALPEDMLVQQATVADARPYTVVESAATVDQLRRLQSLLEGARAPMLVLGGSRWSTEAVARMQAFAERFALPVAVEFRRQMLFDAEHPNYAGDLSLGVDPRLKERVKRSDLLLVVGGQMSDISTHGFSLLGIPTTTQTLIHVHPDPDELGRLYRPELGIVATPDAFAAQLDALSPSAAPGWGDGTREAHAEFLQWSDPSRVESPGRLQMSRVMAEMRERLPADAIVCNGAGNYAIWVHRFMHHRAFGTQLAPTSGSMGYGVPAAMGAQALHPGRRVVAFAGDGCFMMHGQEFATAVQHDLPVVVIVVDNGMYGTIRMHQERDYPGRVSGTQLRNPDFAAYARAFGGHGERVERNEDFAPAFERAVASGKPSIVHCLVDPQAITPTTTIDALRKSKSSR